MHRSIIKNSNIAIYTVNKKDTEKLIEEKSWTQVLRNKARIVTQIFGVIAYAVHTNSINIKEKKGVIEQICAKNTVSIPRFEMK